MQSFLAPALWLPLDDSCDVLCFKDRENILLLSHLRYLRMSTAWVAWTCGTATPVQISVNTTKGRIDTCGLHAFCLIFRMICFKSSAVGSGVASHFRL